jgi:hypothetical protein
MIIIPFTHRIKTVSNITIHIFRILTIGGTTLWKETDSLRLEQDILHPNGIYLDGAPIQWNNAYLCRVDTNKTDMNDFYQWSEVPKNSDIFCWRTFYTFGDMNHHYSWMEIPKQERLEPYSCNDILERINEKKVV